MVEKIELLTRGGIYLAKLNPNKSAEVGKIRPVILLTAQIILDSSPPTVFICPLSSQSHPEFKSLHVQLPPRDNLQVISFALVEHCRAISIERLIYPRLGNLTTLEITTIISKLQIMIDAPICYNSNTSL